MYQHGHPTHSSTERMAQEQGDTFMARPMTRPACIQCRKRKLKCDRQKPKCGTCLRMSSECGYLSPSRQAVPKRRSIKELEGRLAQIETKLQPRGTSLATQTEMKGDNPIVTCPDETRSYYSTSKESNQNDRIVLDSVRKAKLPSEGGPHEMLSLGIEEPLPPKTMQQNLFRIYFDVVQSHMPIINQAKFLAALQLGVSRRPPICLQYAMWCLAASVSQEFERHCDVLYARARKYTESVGIQNHAKCTISVHYAQCWHLLATFEAQRGSLIRSWMSTGRCVRLVQMMGLQSMDNPSLEIKKLLPHTDDFIELEERRRTFWAAFFGDRWVSAGTGWPLSIIESEIHTRLPASESAFENGTGENGPFLPEALVGDGGLKLGSPFAGLILAAALLGRNFTHNHDNTENNAPQDTENGEFWNRHRELDNILSATFMHLPEHLKISGDGKDLRIAFLYMTLHASVICLHKAAVIAIMKHGLDSGLMDRSVSRCIVAAEGITSVMKMISHHNVSKMNPWTGFPLYIAGRVYCHDIRISRSTMSRSQSNLEYILLAMNTIGNRHSVIRPFTTELESEFRATKREIAYQEQGVVCEISPVSTPSTRDTYHLSSNCLPDEKEPLETVENEGSQVNSLSGDLSFYPALSGILLEESPEPSQKNIPPVPVSQNPIAHSVSNFASQQNSADFAFNAGRSQASEQVQDPRNSSTNQNTPPRSIPIWQNQGQMNSELDTMTNSTSFYTEQRNAKMDSFADNQKDKMPNTYFQNKNGTPGPDIDEDMQSNFEEEVRNFQRLFPYNLDGRWGMP